MQKQKAKALFIIIFFIYGVFSPISARADVEQSVANTLTRDPMTLAGGWSQTLGNKLSGTLKEAIFPIRFKRSPYYGPHFFLSITACDNPDYTDCASSDTWGFDSASLDPMVGSGSESDTTLTETRAQGTKFSASKYYSLSLSLNPNANGDGTFQVYGSAAEAYPQGSTDAKGLADMAFKLVGIHRTDTSSTSDATSTPSTATSTLPTTSNGSNVLFLPGIEGSRLYDTQKKLWEPSILSGNDDVQELFLDTLGNSRDQSIHTKESGLVDTTNGADTYGSFITSMNALKSNGSIKDWKAAPYDWRLSLTDLVTSGNNQAGDISYLAATNEPYIQHTLEQLASTSLTGKVTIIAHSNGGLVAKALMQKLGDERTRQLIDKVIFVAVPQSGVPDALAQILLGYESGIPKNLPFVVSPVTARLFARNAPVAYHLLPSAQYFAHASTAHPVVHFSGAHALSKEMARYGLTINNDTELASFMLAKEGGRTEPNANDLGSAIIGNEHLMTYAKTTHDALDSWRPPEGVAVYQLAGWGVSTVEGIDFYEQSGLVGAVTGYRRLYTPDLVQDGDGTVPTASALMLPEGNSIQSYFFNLSKYASSTKDVRSHSNLLGIPTLQNFLKDIILEGTPKSSTYITASKPKATTPKKQVQILAHSPVSLHLSDAAHNETGTNEDGSIEEKIPDSTYDVFGEVKYITAPEDGPYTLVLRGEDTGSVTLDIKETEDDEVVATTTIADIPVTASSTATLTLSNLSDISPLAVDEDGDATADFSITPVLDSIVYYHATTTPPVVEPPVEATSTEITASSTPSLPEDTTTASTTEASSTTIATTTTNTDSTSHVQLTPSQTHSSSIISVVEGLVKGISLVATSTDSTPKKAEVERKDVPMHETSSSTDSRIETESKPAITEIPPEMQPAAVIQALPEFNESWMEKLYAWWIHLMSLVSSSAQKLFNRMHKDS